MHIRKQSLENKNISVHQYNSEGYSVEVSYDKNIDKLKTEWIKLQASENTPFFINWAWISNWIKIYNPKFITVMASLHNTVVAIGLFTLSTENRHGFINSRQLRLNQTGNHNQDQIWIEYNDFISKSDHKKKAVNACLKILYSSKYKWDEIIISMMPSSRISDIETSNFNLKKIMKVPCFSVDLKTIRQSKKTYLATLSSNTRYQIRRSIREYEQKSGKLSLYFAKNKDQAIQFFHEAGALHKKRWNDSGFNNTEFTRFHKQLIQDNFDQKSIELIKVTTASYTIAIMYNLILDKRVYFYLQGVKYDDNKKFKPGLVSHSLITQHYLDNGMELYDYMGGYSQYKTQLASHSSDCYSIYIQRPKIKFALETIGKKLKHVINKQN